MTKTAGKSAFEAREIAFTHSSGLAGSKILADEPGLYRLYASRAGKSESVIVAVAAHCEVLEKSPGSQVRFTGVGIGARPLARRLLDMLTGLRRRWQAANAELGLENGAPPAARATGPN